MKNLQLFWSLIIACLLFNSCSPKEIYNFTGSTGSFNYHHRTLNEANVPINLNTVSDSSDIEVLNIADSHFITAPISTASIEDQLPKPKQKQFEEIHTGTSSKEVKLHRFRQSTKSRMDHIQAIEKHSTPEPTSNKKVHGLALAGFILSILSVALLSFTTLPFVPIAIILFAVTGSILSLIGLIKIKSNPEKYSGKGFAWVGIIVGSIFSILIIGGILFLIAYLNSF